MLSTFKSTFLIKVFWSFYPLFLKGVLGCKKKRIFEFLRILTSCLWEEGRDFNKNLVFFSTELACLYVLKEKNGLVNVNTL